MLHKPSQFPWGEYGNILVLKILSQTRCLDRSLIFFICYLCYIGGCLQGSNYSSLVFFDHIPIERFIMRHLWKSSTVNLYLLQKVEHCIIISLELRFTKGFGKLKLQCSKIELHVCMHACMYAYIHTLMYKLNAYSSVHSSYTK